MRIAFWVSAALAVAACTGPEDRSAAAPATPITVTATTENAATRFHLETSGGMRSAVTATRDATVAPDAAPKVELVGEIAAAVVLVDSYPSIPGGLSMCQAGEERFLRVLALTGGKAEETFRLKVASCRENLELAAPALEWLPESSAVRIHWLLGPTSGLPEVRTLRIGANGEARAVPGRTHQNVGGSYKAVMAALALIATVRQPRPNGWIAAGQASRVPPMQAKPDGARATRT